MTKIPAFVQKHTTVITNSPITTLKKQEDARQIPAFLRRRLISGNRKSNICPIQWVDSKTRDTPAFNIQSRLFLFTGNNIYVQLGLCVIFPCS